MTHSSVTFITGKSDDDYQAVTQVLHKRTGINFVGFKTVGELFTSLSSPRFTSDLIILDLDSVTQMDGTDLFEIVSTISTLIKCTVVRVNPGRPVRRSIPIAVAAHSKTSPDLFKQVAGTEVIGVYPSGTEFTVEDKILALTALLNGQHYIPPAIVEQIRPSKKKTFTKKSTVALTPRQQQIFFLIKERGATNKTIAKILHISESTVKLHVTGIFKKYGVRNRTQLAVFDPPEAV